MRRGRMWLGLGGYSEGGCGEGGCGEGGCGEGGVGKTGVGEGGGGEGSGGCDGTGERREARERGKGGREGGMGPYEEVKSKSKVAGEAQK